MLFQANLSSEEFSTLLFTVNRGNQDAWSHHDVDMASHLPVTPLPNYTDWHTPLDKRVLSGSRFPCGVDKNLGSSINPSNNAS
ncbi:hypothetical protein ScPMuIL_017243 [Solemya velum]